MFQERQGWERPGWFSPRGTAPVSDGASSYCCAPERPCPAPYASYPQLESGLVQPKAGCGDGSAILHTGSPSPACGEQSASLWGTSQALLPASRQGPGFPGAHVCEHSGQRGGQYSGDSVKNFPSCRRDPKSSCSFLHIFLATPTVSLCQ